MESTHSSQKKALLPQGFFSDIRLSQASEIAFGIDIQHTLSGNARGCDGIL
ncbi:MAG TPA: hypothetical protein PK854_08085 [Oscillospiraceae bacterium]|nr:hypothetical protein [Oscillospiraceae bacterium]HPS35209.1 hypothetical protein [Oscillospiraceae bacterium]